MAELKPCPFCGGKAQFDKYSEWEYIECNHNNTCYIAPNTWRLMKFVPIEEQIKIWNRRAEVKQD